MPSSINCYIYSELYGHMAILWTNGNESPTRQTDRQKEVQASRQTDRQNDRKTDVQPDGQDFVYFRQTDGKDKQ